MDCRKIGALICKLRKEKGMSQKVIADKMHISDKTVSKWERGLGCPDVSLLSTLSDIFEVNIEQLLLGTLNEKEMDGGNLKHIKFYACTNCGNFLTATSKTDTTCCGRRLNALVVNPEDDEHKITITDNGNDYYVILDHPMSKSHFISFVAYVGFDRLLLIKLYPEQAAAFHMPKIQRGKVYIYCSEHGLRVTKI